MESRCCGSRYPREYRVKFSEVRTRQKLSAFNFTLFIFSFQLSPLAGALASMSNPQRNMRSVVSQEMQASVMEMP
jgi:hypothetical protein